MNTVYTQHWIDCALPTKPTHTGRILSKLGEAKWFTEFNRYSLTQEELAFYKLQVDIKTFVSLRELNENISSRYKNPPKESFEVCAVIREYIYA